MEKNIVKVNENRVKPFIYAIGVVSVIVLCLISGCDGSSRSLNRPPAGEILLPLMNLQG